MSWLNTLLDVGIISMQLSQRSKLEQLQQGQAAETLVRVVIQALREEIFKYRQAAEEILVLERKDPKVAAAAMKILFLRLKNLRLSADLFPEISDKEYFAATNRLIRENSTRLIRRLVPAEQKEVNRVAAVADALSDLTYYLEKYQDAQKYRQALLTIERLKTLNHGCVTISLVLTLMFVLFALPFMLNIEGQGTGILCLTNPIIGGIVLFIYYNQIARSKDYRAAKKVVSKLEGEVDLERFADLDKRFGHSYQRALNLKKQAQSILRDFFGSSGMPIMLPD